MDIRSTLGFFRTFHGIPKKQKVAWCIYHTSESNELRLGVLLINTNKMIDVASARFVQVRQDKNLQPLLAIRSSFGDYYVYTADNGANLSLPKSYVADMYRELVYSPELIESYLF